MDALDHGTRASRPANAGHDGPHTYCAPDYDTLVDSPILIGNPELYEFSVDGVPHVLANAGDATFFDSPRAVKDLEAIVRAHKEFWGSFPYQRYVFINLLTEAGGGLEHARSSVLMTSRWTTRTRKAYLGWLELASHELFHAWNVKRLRPIELGPFDYEREVFTPSLWVVEGITDYYGDVLVLRAGRSSAQEFLDSLSDKIEELQTTPGRAVRSVTQASMDAWIKLYRPDENTPNTAISYYTKGAVVGVPSRREDSTGNRVEGAAWTKCMREAYARYSATRASRRTSSAPSLSMSPASTSAPSGGPRSKAQTSSTTARPWRSSVLQFRPANGFPNGEPKAWMAPPRRSTRAV